MFWLVILVAEYIPAWYLLRGIYNCKLSHAAFLRQGKTVNVLSCDVCMVPFVEDNIIVYLLHRLTHFVLYGYYNSNTFLSASQDRRLVCHPHCYPAKLHVGASPRSN